MKSAKTKRRKIWVGAVVLFWLAVGIAVPLIFDISGDDVQFDSAAVVAAPRDRFKITRAIVLDKNSGATLTGGMLGIAAPKGEALTAESSSALLKSGDAVLLLDEGELTVGAKAGNAGLASAPLAQALQQGRFKALALRHSTVIAVLPNGHRERLTDATFQLIPSNDGAVDVKGEGFWRGQRSKFSLKSGTVEKNGDVPIQFSFSATLLDFAYNGTVKLPVREGEASALQGPAVVHLKDTEKLANALGTSWPIGTSVQDIRIEGPLRWQSDTLAFDQAKVRVGANDAEGTVSLKTAGGQGLISSTLAFDKLDVASYLPSGPTDRSVLAWQWWNKLVGTLSQPAAPHINADIRLSAKTLSSGGHDFGQAAATVSMKDGKLSADIAEIALSSGRATGQISIDFNRYIPKLTLRGQLQDIATGPWLEMLAGKRYIEGQGRVIADLSSQGVSVHQIIGDLTGTVEFAVPENGAIGLSLVELNKAHEKPQQQSTKETLARVMRGSTVIKDLEAVLKVKDGVANVVKASATHATGSVKASGSFDLARQVYDFRMLSLAGNTTPAKPETPIDGKQAKVEPVSPLVAQAPSAATLVAVKSTQSLSTNADHKAGATAYHVPEVQLRALTGLLKELERFLGPDYSHIPRRGL